MSCLCQDRLSGADLAILATYLYGARWQCATARKLDCAPRLVRARRSGQRPVSARLSRDLVAIVCARRAFLIGCERTRHATWLVDERAQYGSLVQSIGSSEMRALLLAI